MTETFGPIIITIIFMFDDIKRFLTIWAIVVVSFAAVFNYPFMETGMTFEEGLLYWAQTAMGEINMDVLAAYDELPARKLMGTYMVLIFVFINALVLLNFVIAMMADTYTEMT